ncbi:beta-microseminoprotein-like [Puntigrus tetrazona]|uniref:beta-microseminoprotein-like n=1 Tax=Puntigrus tetrazona TaxID=1606681 RepID=UPI001C8A24B7|nr:beta-microseminoprotein-like [Puntigrus tetrazona]
MASLALVLVFCAFVSLSESACFLKQLNPGTSQCVDDYDDSKHLMGSTWTNSKCIRCTCSPGEMKCCNVMGRVSSITEGCVVKYDYKTCTFDVFHPEDPTIKCAFGTVGK